MFVRFAVATSAGRTSARATNEATGPNSPCAEWRSPPRGLTAHRAAQTPLVVEPVATTTKMSAANLIVHYGLRVSPLASRPRIWPELKQPVGLYLAAREVGPGAKLRDERSAFADGHGTRGLKLCMHPQNAVWGGRHVP